MKARLLPALVAAAIGLPAAHAADIYRWVDDAGKTHLSDTVPERYRSRATRVDSDAYELSPAQRAIAEARARQAGRAAAASAASSPAPAISLGGAPAASIGAASRAAANDARDCAGWQRRYIESQECFAPYKLVNGGIKPEAFQRCTEVPDPATACGAPRTP
ncbi:DUF4124 domain-containing protein [Rhizobacter sp. Root404]|uniref:DUF4124 domain-containing protein n=1 Tax=Rhizobacter sp. Root404 TaxID=1736528 RepID=UPI0006F3DDFE|nr:DUF4124 domain-containing protein [Rhizobacter sp. Root404]KQW38984.1 hypothetical protein ASC76_13605 [Rhizobacter sp. Root404]